MKKYTKLLVLVLSLALIIGAVAIVASADNGKVAKVGDTEYETLAAALDAAEDGAMVTLIADATIGTYDVVKNVTVNLGGKTLTTTEEVAFKLTKTVTFNLTGNGVVNSQGTLIKTLGEEDPTVNVTTVNNGMTIVHKGKIKGVFADLFVGTVNFTGVTMDLGCPTTDDALFTTATGAKAKLNLTACEITALRANSVNDTVFYISSDSEVKLDKCYVNTSGVFSKFNTSTSEKPLWVLDSNLIGTPYAVDNDTRKVNFLSGWGGKLNNPVIIENSYLEYFYRLWDAQGAGVNFVNSTVCQNGYSNSATGTDMNLSRYMPINFDENSRLFWHEKGGMTFDKSGSNGSVYVKEGFRTNTQRFFNFDEFSSFIFPDGKTAKTSETYKFVYDPYTDVKCPYVLVDITKEGAITSDTLTADFFAFDNAQQIFTSNVNGVILGDDATMDAKRVLMNNLTIWNIGSYEGLGSVEVHRNEDNVALKYWVPDYGTGEETRVLYFEGVDASGKPQGKAPVILPGYNQKFTLTDYKVITYEIDIATDSDQGFPMTNIQLQGSGTRTTYLEIQPDGTITSSKLTNKDNLANVNLADGKYHRISVVYYTESLSVNFYIDNVYVGTGTENSNNTTIQGFRFDIRSGEGSPQKIGSSILFDNLLLRAFKDYQNNDTKDAPTADFYLSKLAIEDTVTDAISLLGDSFNNVVDAMTAAGSYSGRAPELNANVTIPNVITVNGFVAANGYTINIGEGSYAADVVYDANGNIATYEFNSAYNDLFVKYAWFIGNTMDETYDNVNYIFTTVKVGQIPTAPEGTANKAPWKMSDSGKLLISEIGGWSREFESDKQLDFAPVSVAEAKIFDPDNPIYVYPVMGEYKEKDYRWFITDSNGNVLRGGTANNLWGSQMVSNFALTYGETLVLAKDLLIYGQLSTGGFKAAEDGNKTLGLDLNGCTLTISPLTAGTRKESGWTIKAGETLNVYSSRPGGHIFGEGFDDKNKGKADQYTSRASGGTVFNFAPSAQNFADNKGDTQMNAHLNIGTYNGKYAGNLTVSGATAVAVQSGDKTCTVTVDGATLVRNSVDYMGLVFSRFFYGTFTIKNSTLINVVDGGDTLIGGVAAAAVVTEGVLESTDATVIVDNCALIAKKDGANILATTHSLGSVTFTNCYTNGSIARSSDLKKNVIVGENVAAAAYGEGVLAEGIVVGAFNQPMSFKALGIADSDTVTYKYIYTPKTESGTIAATSALQRLTITFASNGYTGNDANVVLGTFVNKTVKAEELYKVTFKGIGGNDDIVVDYAKGGKIVVPEILGKDLTVVSIVHDGSFVETVPEVVTEAITLTPTVKNVAKLEGIKTNLSVYSDFVINVYVPAAYEEYITAITDGNNVLATAKVTVDQVEYIKVSFAVNANDASAAVNAVISVKETDVAATATVEVSVASYAETILAGESYTAADKQLMYYVVNYANEAAKYFGKAEDEALKALLETYASAKGNGLGEQTYANAIETLALGNVFEYATVELAASPAFVLTVKEGFAGTVTVTYGTCTRTYTVTADSDRAIVLEGMKAYNFGLELTVNADGTIGETAVKTENAKYNLDTFVKYHVNSEAEESVACEALLVALYDYVACATAYVAK